MNYITRKLLCEFICMLLFFSFGQICVSEDVNNSKGEPLAELMFEPHSYDFQYLQMNETASTIFEIWRGGGCCDLAYWINESCSWIDVFPTSGVSNGEHDPIIVTVNTTGLEPAFYTYNIPISSNGGNGVFTVNVTVIDNMHPYLRYSPESFDFGNMAENKTDYTVFEIWNQGGDLLIYYFIEECTWVEVSPMDGGSQGEHDPITVSINTTGLVRGFYICNISIFSNGGNKTFVTTVNIVVDPVLSYAPESYDFGDMHEGEKDSTLFEIWNDGIGILNYSLIENSNWVSITPTSGQAQDEHDLIIVKIDTTGLSIGFYVANINIESNGGNGTFNVSVTIIDTPEIEVELSGGFGVTIIIKNVGDFNATDVKWSIMLNGGFILSPSGGTTNGITNIPAGLESSIKIFVLGFGKTVITVTVNDLEEIADGFVFMFFVLGVHQNQ